MNTSDDQELFYYNESQHAINEHFKHLPSTFLRDIHRPITPQSSRDSGIPIPSSSSSSCCSSPPMSHIYDSTSRYRPHVHWNDGFNHSFEKENHLTHIKKQGQRITLNTSLPFHSKLNIRIHANRLHQNQVKATASIQRLNPRYEHEYIEGVRQAYYQHYSTLSTNENLQRNSLIRYEKLPTHRQISLPISLPVDQRLFLYIHNGEVFARC